MGESVKNIRTSRTSVILAVALAFVLGIATMPANAKDKAPTTRTMTGHVVGVGDAPVADAVVYLTNTKTADIRTYIADKEGAFHFSALSQSVDYQVYAKYKDHKSEVKTLSQFDSRTEVVFNLHIVMP